jgi:hypothetical protein
LRPAPLSEHTLTSAEGHLYAFGGSGLNGKFSQKMFRISETGLDEWEPVEIRGTKETDLRVTGHSTVYSELCRHDTINYSFITFFRWSGKLNSYFSSMTVIAMQMTS